MRVLRCGDPARLAELEAVAVGLQPTQDGRLLGIESTDAHRIVERLVGVAVAPVVRFYTTTWGRMKPHRDAAAFNAGTAQTLIVYLSDCAGGDLFFATGERVETKRGVAVVFDKATVHWTDPVTEGTKRCVVCDVVRDVVRDHDAAAAAAASS